MHGSPFSLATKIIELQSSMETEKKSHKEAITTLAEMTFCMDKVVKALHQDNEYREKERETYEARLDDLMNEVNEALNRTLKRVYYSFDEAVGQFEALCFQFFRFSAQSLTHIRQLKMELWFRTIVFSLKAVMHDFFPPLFLFLFVLSVFPNFCM